MPRQPRQQIEDGTVDRAAALFARHGFQETSVQRIADAVGYSKGGLLRMGHPAQRAPQEARGYRPWHDCCTGSGWCPSGTAPSSR